MRKAYEEPVIEVVDIDSEIKTFDPVSSQQGIEPCQEF